MDYLNIFTSHRRLKPFAASLVVLLVNSGKLNNYAANRAVKNELFTGVDHIKAIYFMANNGPVVLSLTFKGGLANQPSHPLIEEENP